MRRTLRTIVLLGALLGALALPTVQASGSPPTTTVTRVGVDLAGDGRVTTVTAGDAVSVTADIDGRHVELRWRDAAGWSDWVGLAAAGEHAPDPDSPEADGVDRGVSEPVWVGTADTLQLRSPTPGSLALELITVDGNLDYRPGATPPASAEAFAVWPPIVPRVEWDPNGECQPRGTPDIAPAVERIVVHHTVVFPDYAPEEGDDVVRAICLGHVNQRGFSDVGYNFLIDRYGVIYQGRAGGILNAVEGAHAQGFNWGSAGIALVGDFDETTVPPAAARSLDRLTAWLADLHGIDPLGHGVAVSTGGPSTRFPEGTAVDLPAIVGHRDTALNSSCPGDHLYDIVRGRRPIAPRVRQRLAADYGHPAPHPEDPTRSATEPVPAAAPGSDGGRAAEALLSTVGSIIEGWPSRDASSLVTRVLSGAAVGAGLGR